MATACDCLNYCGDDPWLQDGRAAPCDRKKARDRKAAELQAKHARVSELLQQLGHLEVLSALEELATLRQEVGELRTGIQLAKDAEAHYWQGVVERVTWQADAWNRRYWALVKELAELKSLAAVTAVAVQNDRGEAGPEAAR